MSKLSASQRRELRKQTPPLVMLPFDRTPDEAGDAWEPGTLRNIPALERGRDAYATQAHMRAYLPDALRTWEVAGRLTSMQMPGEGMVKGIDRFAHRHVVTEESFSEFLKECAFFDCPRPSSYSSVFHTVYKSPRVRWSLHALFAPWFVGGWQQARKVGLLPGTWRQYDMNSAYLWAVTRGLPDVDSMRVSNVVGRWPGMYALELTHTLENLPYPFNTNRVVNATTEELDAYALPVARILGGVIWSGEIDGAPIVDAVKQFTFAKECARSFWGRWCATTPVECAVRSGKRWQLPNNIQNFVWAHLIVSRVKARVWAESPNAAHIFVDSVITTDELPTGEGLGDWRQTELFENGVRIKHAGYYGAPHQWRKTSGASRDIRAGSA